MDNTLVKRNRFLKKPTWLLVWNVEGVLLRVETRSKINNLKVMWSRVWNELGNFFVHSSLASLLYLKQPPPPTVRRGQQGQQGQREQQRQRGQQRQQGWWGVFFSSMFFYFTNVYLQDRLPRQHQGSAARKVQQRQAWPPSPRPPHHHAQMTTTPLGK